MLRTAVDNPHVGNQIVAVGLCVRCGACEPACPVDIIKFDADAYPYITDEELCIKACTRCIKVCPGGEVDFGKLDDEIFGVRPHPESITGVAKRAYVSFSTDDGIREAGASGGFVTQLLLYMLEEKMIDGALVLGTTLDEAGWRIEPLIARTPDEVKRAAKSKYTAVPFLKPLQEIEWGDEGSYAVVALPCYAHALRKYQKVSPKLRKRIKLVIGLYCNVVYEPKVLDDLRQFSGIAEKDIANVDFRAGTWPGGIWATQRDGTQRKLLKLEDMKDEVNLLKLFYTASRCNMCIDFSAEYADIAVGDPWLRAPDGSYLFPDGRTTVLVRTDIGQEIVSRVEAAGQIALEELPLKTYMVNFETNARYKRDWVPKNIKLRKMLGLAAPQYNRPMVGGKPTTWISVLLRNALLLIGRLKWFRRFCLFLAQTAPVVALFRWNRKRKARNFAAQYSRSEQFVERLSQTGQPSGNGSEGSRASRSAAAL
jgi:coenzyme F420 hydrogenase subunit beta